MNVIKKPLRTKEISNFPESTNEFEDVDILLAVGKNLGKIWTSGTWCMCSVRDQCTQRVRQRHARVYLSPAYQDAPRGILCCGQHAFAVVSLRRELLRIQESFVPFISLSALLN
ncbi:unnamed protein product, partial [Iphiclides podalirius]